MRRGHLVLASANTPQPGVFGVSNWDLVGALPVPLEVSEEIDPGDAEKGAAGAWTDILTGEPGGAVEGVLLKVRLPSLAGATLVPAKRK